ncbi:MAG: hypothetical protein NT153_07165 [Bacteroidetes bacterium]|nr:hypothetical protein [Bacteroidota bacterium]
MIRSEISELMEKQLGVLSINIIILSFLGEDFFMPIIEGFGMKANKPTESINDKKVGN